MSEIPEDIMQVARHAAFPDDDNQPLVEAIARAIMAERERATSRAVAAVWASQDISARDKNALTTAIWGQV